jgi:hypothetical protein
VARMARIFGLYRLVVVVCAYSKIYFFLMMFLCNSGSLVYGATVYSTTVTSDTVTGVHMQQACS